MTAPLPEPQPGASARPWRVLADLARSDCPVDWMQARLPDNAIPIGRDLPPLRQDALGWLSAPEVCIWFKPAIVWRTPSHPGCDDEWWSSLPGQYLDLRHYRWHLSHWLPLSSVNAHEALVAALTTLRAKFHRALVIGGTDAEFADAACEQADAALNLAAAREGRTDG